MKRKESREFYLYRYPSNFARLASIDGAALPYKLMRANEARRGAPRLGCIYFYRGEAHLALPRFRVVRK